jgi:hypothetical protein
MDTVKPQFKLLCKIGEVEERLLDLPDSATDVRRLKESEYVRTLV